jgi:hypothetical protein
MSNNNCNKKLIIDFFTVNKKNINKWYKRLKNKVKLDKKLQKYKKKLIQFINHI